MEPEMQQYHSEKNLKFITQKEEAGKTHALSEAY